MPGRTRRGRLALVVIAVLLAVVLAGCRVTTTVAVRVDSNGTGAVTVSVAFDRRAAAQVGGVAGQLRTSDLVQAGWVVTGPTRGPRATTIVAVSHPFTSLSEVPGLLAEVAAGRRARVPFVLHVSRSVAPARVTTTATGQVDLRCGISCFGDVALQKAFGSEVGVNASSLTKAAAARDFPFVFTLQLPGRLASSDAGSSVAGVLRWHAALGQTTTLHAATVITIPVPIKPRPAPTAARSPADGASGSGAVVIVAVVVLVMAGALLWRLGRRRRRRRGGRGRRGGHGGGSGMAGSTTTSSTSTPA